MLPYYLRLTLNHIFLWFEVSLIIILDSLSRDSVIHLLNFHKWWMGFLNRGQRRLLISKDLAIVVLSSKRTQISSFTVMIYSVYSLHRNRRQVEGPKQLLQIWQLYLSDSFSIGTFVIILYRHTSHLVFHYVLTLLRDLYLTLCLFLLSYKILILYSIQRCKVGSYLSLWPRSLFHKYSIL